MNDLLLTAIDNQNVASLIARLILACLLGWAIATVYKKTHRGISYSQAFVQALVILLPIGTTIFYFIANSIATAIGLFGAFSLIRFRTAVKEVQDMLYIFWVLAISLVIGSGNLMMAVLVTGFIALVVYLLYLSNFGKLVSYEYVLTYQFDSKKNGQNEINDQLREFLDSQEMLNVRNIDKGKVLEINLGIKLKKDRQSDDLIKKLLKTKGVKSANLVSIKQNSEF